MHSLSAASPITPSPTSSLRVSEEQEQIGLDLSQHGEVMQDVSAFAPAIPAEEVFAKIA